MLNKDYKEMLQILLDNEVEFLVVGAYAMGIYGYPRATGDIGIWRMTSTENSEKILKALKQFGAPLQQINDKTFTEQGIIFQIGVAPRRIDIITQIDGVDFDKAYENRQEVAIENMRIPVISREDLIKNKESTSREKDAFDVKELRKIDKKK